MAKRSRRTTDAPWQRHARRLEHLATLPANFDPSQREVFTEENGWHLDAYEADLPRESPGPPARHGPWHIACRLVRNYAFPDPQIVTGIYLPGRPLEERVMLLEARFLFLTFYFGVKIGQVIDETRETEDGPVRVWGYSYQTLEGHFEKGEMTFEVWKFLETGAVQFRIHAYSQPDRIRNPFYRIGFKLFGRTMQKKFAHRALERMQQFVAEEVDTGQPPEQEETPDVAIADAAQQEKLTEEAG